MIEKLYTLNEAVSAFVWGPPMLALFLGVGVYFTIRLRGLQFTHLKEIVLSPFRSGGAAGGSISAFSAVSGALAGTLGIGNIVGVAGALMLGGPGVVFWMILSAFLCMILKYAETVLALCYRTKNDAGEAVGGPMYYMRDGLGLKILPVVFCALCIATALFGAGNVTQIGTVSLAVEETFHIPGLCVSLVCVVAVALMTGGSVGRLGKVFSFLTPVASVAFMAASIGVVLKNAGQIPAALSAILAGAMKPQAAAGGVGAYTLLAAMKYGVSRGVFSNEAGLGSSPIIHAASDNTPARQGFCGAFEVFFDTVVMAGITALAILVSGAPLTATSSTALAAQSFQCIFGEMAAPVLTVMLVVFAVSSVPCWYFYGDKCVEYLSGCHKGGNRKASKGTASRLGGGRRLYRWAFFILMAVCPLIRLEGMWQLADSLNGLMAFPNLCAVVMLSKDITAATAVYRGGESRTRRTKRPASSFTSKSTQRCEPR